MSGNLCMRRPWPGMARTIYKDHKKYLNTYFRPYPGLYFTGDGAFRDENGHYQITGRVDDVINVKGHRIGTAELESCMVRLVILSGITIHGCCCTVTHYCLKNGTSING